jgi:acyl carrier protein
VRTDEQFLSDLGDVMRRAFPDREYSGAVGLQTRLFADLGLASIDAVVLAEHIERHYGRRLPFGPFLAGLRAKGADDLTLGELVAFLQRMTNDPPMTHQ